MRIARAALFSGLAVALLAAGTAETAAQAEIGIHGTLADVRDINPGIGGRLAFLRPTSSGTRVGIEGKYTYYFPDCNGLECSAWGGHIVLLGVRPMTAGAETYAGVGAAYVEVSVDNGSGQTSGDAWGVMVLIGSRFKPDNPVVPFFEFGWQFMDGFPDVWDITLGLRAPLGGRR